MSDARPLPAVELITRLNDIEEGLSTWELDFIARMEQLVNSNQTLSQGRYNKLWEIYTEKG